MRPISTQLSRKPAIGHSPVSRVVMSESVASLTSRSAGIPAQASVSGSTRSTAMSHPTTQLGRALHVMRTEQPSASRTTERFVGPYASAHVSRHPVGIVVAGTDAHSVEHDNAAAIASSAARADDECSMVVGAMVVSSAGGRSPPHEIVNARARRDFEASRLETPLSNHSSLPQEHVDICLLVDRQ